MTHFIKFAAALALAMVVSQADAQSTTYPTQTDPSGGALIVSIWDPVAGVSLAYATGSFYQDLVDGSFASIGPIVVPEFAQTFAGSDPANILYQVYAAGLDAANGRSELFVTGPANALPNVQVNNITGTFTNSNTVYNALANACGDATSCAATAADGNYLGFPTWGDLSAQLYNAAAAVGNSLAFYQLSQPDVARVRGTDPAVTGLYAAGATWLLSADGMLQYSQVPLPAAVWLLLSGLAGFGAISRRRQSA